MGRPPAHSLCRLTGRLRSRLAAEDGVTLIETLISAVILVIIVGAVLTTIDASGRTASINKHRTIAASLAEQDQERMRAMSPTALIGHTLTQTVNVPAGGPAYTVDSKSEWVSDTTGSGDSCERAANPQDYLQISSTVTSSVVGTRVKPIILRSIVAPRVNSSPPNTGTLVVFVKDEVGAPVSNMSVAINPVNSVPVVTNSLGCAVFSNIPAGAYAATVDKAGWVNEQRQRTFAKNTTVLKNTTNPLSMTYARAASITATFVTGTSPGSPIASNAHALTVSNTNSGDLVFLAPTETPVPTLEATDLFPFTDGYSAYSGRCAQNDPSDAAYTATVPASYFTAWPRFTNVAPGATATVRVHQPAVNGKVVNGSGADLAGVNVILSPSLGACSPTTTPVTNRFLRVTGTDGYIPDRGLPFGTYDACIDKGALRMTLGPFPLTSPGGTLPQTIPLFTPGSACPST